MSVLTAMRIETAGENALLLTFGDTIDPSVLAQVQQTAALLDAEAPRWLVDMTPSYASLLILFDPAIINRVGLRRYLRARLADLKGETIANSSQIEVPVYYGLEAGPDLARIARHARCDIEEVIALHHQTEYRVYALGFAPGFAYLGQVPQRLATPRLETPRQAVPCGAVAIADRQTAVYPAPTPGGWNLIGLCPLTLFDPQRNPPTLWQTGDRVRFRAVELEEFLALGGELP